MARKGLDIQELDHLLERSDAFGASPGDVLEIISTMASRCHGASGSIIRAAAQRSFIFLPAAWFNRDAAVRANGWSSFALSLPRTASDASRSLDAAFTKHQWWPSNTMRRSRTRFSTMMRG